MHSAFFVEVARFSGGPQSRLLRLARGWADRGYSTAVVALRGDQRPGDRERRYLPMPVHVLTPHGRAVLKSHRLDVAWAVRRWVRRHGPSLVFAMESLADYHVKLGLLGMATPLVTLLGIDRWHWERKRYRVLLMRLLAARGAALVGNSQRTLAGYERVLGQQCLASIPRLVLHNPADPEQFRPRFDRDHPDALVIGALGRLCDQKGIDILLAAFAKLPAAIEGKTTRLKLKGDGPLRGDLERLALELGVRDRVEFVPFSPDVEPFLHSLDCLVVPSRWAGLENVALEGMLTGTLTVFSAETGLQELPWDAGTSLLALDPDGMAAQLHDTLRLSPAERGARAQAQRAFVVAHLSLPAVTDRLESFLRAQRLLS